MRINVIKTKVMCITGSKDENFHLLGCYYAYLKMEAEDRLIWHATNRTVMSKTCFLADN